MTTIELPVEAPVEPTFSPEIELAVERGWAYLDNELGIGWWNEIDCAILNIRSGCHCIIGQLYGTYPAGPRWSTLDQNPVRLGFMWDLDITTHDESFQYSKELTACWKHRLHCERRAHEND